jgi:hypothetical protein
VSLPPQPGFVNGREELLAELDARLTVGHETGPRVLALYGLAGAGKTSVALEYAYRHLAEVGVAWYFRAEDSTVLVAGFSELAAQLGAREVVDARDPVKSVHAVLAAYPTDWLLIFHNAPGRETMGPFLPPAGRGRVVITSGYRFWSPGQALEVPTLGSDAAVAFLRSWSSCGSRTVLSIRNAWAAWGKQSFGAGRTCRVRVSSRPCPRSCAVWLTGTCAQSSASRAANREG